VWQGFGVVSLSDFNADRQGFRLPETPPAAAPAQCQAVLRALDGVVARFAGLPSEHPCAVHHDFARLYGSVTRHWLERLADHPDGAFAYHVIPPFYALYEQRVLQCLDAPPGTIVPHWRSDHRLARQMGPGASDRVRLWLVILGARAHTHHDLGEAILQAEERTGTILSDARRLMFGHLASTAFLDATDAFFAPSPWRHLLTLSRPVWVPVLHHWRISGYRRVQAVLCATRGRV